MKFKQSQQERHWRKARVAAPPSTSILDSCLSQSQECFRHFPRDPKNFILLSQDFNPRAHIGHFYRVNLANTSPSPRSEAFFAFRTASIFHVMQIHCSHFLKLVAGQDWDASSWSLRITPAAELHLIALALFSKGRQRSEGGFSSQNYGPPPLLHFLGRWGKKRGDICHLLGSEKTQQAFLLQANLWRCIDMRLVCAAWWISRIAVIASPIQTPHSYSFFFFPPSTSNLSAIWSSHRLAARNKPGWWKQVDPSRGSVRKTTVV